MGNPDPLGLTNLMAQLYRGKPEEPFDSWASPKSAGPKELFAPGGIRTWDVEGAHSHIPDLLPPGQPPWVRYSYIIDQKSKKMFNIFLYKKVVLIVLVLVIYY